jgi:hypothetical protein
LDRTAQPPRHKDTKKSKGNSLDVPIDQKHVETDHIPDLEPTPNILSQLRDPRVHMPGVSISSINFLIRMNASPVPLVSLCLGGSPFS